MSLPHGHKLNNEEIKKNLLVFIYGFKAALNLSDIEMANYLCLTGSAYKKMVNGKLNLSPIKVVLIRAWIQQLRCTVTSLAAK
jgi:hypothetical protein